MLHRYILHIYQLSLFSITVICLSRDEKNEATVLYNAMIHPLLPMPIYGAIWYQGSYIWNSSLMKKY